MEPSCRYRLEYESGFSRAATLPKDAVPLGGRRHVGKGPASRGGSGNLGEAAFNSPLKGTGSLSPFILFGSDLLDLAVMLGF